MNLLWLKPLELGAAILTSATLLAARSTEVLVDPSTVIGSSAAKANCSNRSESSAKCVRKFLTKRSKVVVVMVSLLYGEKVLVVAHGLQNIFFVN